MVSRKEFKRRRKERMCLVKRRYKSLTEAKKATSRDLNLIARIADQIEGLLDVQITGMV